MSKPAYITVTCGMRGHYAVMVDGDTSEPIQAGTGSYATQLEAEPEARQWAEDLGLEFRPVPEAPDIRRVRGNMVLPVTGFPIQLARAILCREIGKIHGLIINDPGTIMLSIDGQPVAAIAWPDVACALVEGATSRLPMIVGSRVMQIDETTGDAYFGIVRQVQQRGGDAEVEWAPRHRSWTAMAKLVVIG